jgi:hypothetical protein
VRLIVWCKACGHRVEPHAAEMAGRYGAETAVPSGACGSSAPGAADKVVAGRAAVALTAPPYLDLPADRSRPFADIRLDPKIEVRTDRAGACSKYRRRRTLSVLVYFGLNDWLSPHLWSIGQQQTELSFPILGEGPKATLH